MAWTDPRTWVAGEIPDAGNFNTHVRDNFDAIGDPWPTYTPTWTASTTDPTLGNGVLEGWAVEVGKLTFFVVELTFGSTTDPGSGTWDFGLPSQPRSSLRTPIGNILCRDDSVGTVRLGNLQTFSTSGVRAQTFDDVPVGAAAPFTWATGDMVTLTGFYEAA